jgi:hypothetical protein
MLEERNQFPQGERRAQPGPDGEAARPTRCSRNAGWEEIGSDRYGHGPADDHRSQEREGEGTQVRRPPGVPARGQDPGAVSKARVYQACLDIRRENSSVGLPVTDTKGWMLGADIEKSDQANW